MKEIKQYEIGDQIPSNAKYVDAIATSNNDFLFFYEVPIATKTSAKKDADEKETLATIERVITYLNKKTGSKYTAKAKGHASKIRARINEGAKPEQFKDCIDNMCAQWLEDDRMRQYLRPETLFSQKFWGYLTAKSGEQMTEETFAELDKLIEGIGDE